MWWDRESVHSMWVLHHVNDHAFIGRFDGRWTHTRDIDVAALWSSHAEAEQALQAFLGEAQDRVSGNSHAAPWWWDCYGGLVIVAEVEVITRLKPRERTTDAHDAVDPIDGAQADRSTRDTNSLPSNGLRPPADQEPT